MRPLTSQNIESELSYAYIHAVAASAGMGCEVAGRHDDAAGVDAKITAWGPFKGGLLQEVDLKVQLKATVKPPTLAGSCFSYSLAGIPRYDDLRSTEVATPRILVVLFLPSRPEEWVSHSTDALMLRNCAYWVSLRGADPSSNATAQTVYIPQMQKFDPAGLTELMSSLSRFELPSYKGSEP
ncbi:DUF4365 domain-containing protein [Gellertiella hungarica]|uniref:DUF4365 domain-containing protein n=1 Tax=Gellertiella hungarica TaxID=1572859 RepID=A0A7W6J3R6_9HYPH|nr:DUF4365 domain-containing protein [Gellertiella hungarica]MBB4064230.1 hypothetical protein [Gellertiella hungarica]